MKDLAALLTRTESYQGHHAEWVSAGHALQAEREAIIALGKSVGCFAGRLNAELPKIPTLPGIAVGEPHPAAPPAPESIPGAISGERPCADMTDDEICLGYVEIVHRKMGENDGPEINRRCFAFEAQITARSLTPRRLGAIAFRQGLPVDRSAYVRSCREGFEWETGWLEEKDSATAERAA